MLVGEVDDWAEAHVGVAGGEGGGGEGAEEEGEREP